MKMDEKEKEYLAKILTDLALQLLEVRRRLDAIERQLNITSN